MPLPSQAGFDRYHFQTMQASSVAATTLGKLRALPLQCRLFSRATRSRHSERGPHPTGVSLRSIGYYWGLLGVIGLIGSAVLRLSPRMFELTSYSLAPLQWLVLLVFTPYMAYAEGYKGFHQNFAPRVVARALYLRDMNGHETALQKTLMIVLAPLFCMGFFHATRKRMIASWLVTSAIVALVIAVSHTAQPWRGIVDTGVVVGLALGIASLLWHWLRFEIRGQRPAIPTDLP
jgi:hypothetical protein